MSCFKSLAMFPIKIVYAIATLFILLGFLLLTSLTSEFMPPYNYGRSFSRNGNCTVVSNAFNGTVCCQSTVDVITDCDEDYVYPCLQVPNRATFSEQFDVD